MVTEPMPKIMNGPVVNSFFTHSVDAGATVLFGGIQEATGGIVISQANRPGNHFDTGVDFEDISLMARLFLSHYPLMRDAQLLRSWSGVTTVSRDEKPLWGFSSVFRNLFFAVALKGAFSLATAIGRYSGEMLLGKEPPEGAEAWSPGRVNI
jgi:glycine/D-amino acid oxidase-like deaminating enzyme